MMEIIVRRNLLQPIKNIILKQQLMHLKRTQNKYKTDFYVANLFFEMEGFEEITYVPKISDGSEARTLAENQADLGAGVATDWIRPIAEGLPVKVISGLHAGCVELFANKSVRRSTQDLRAAIR